MKKLVTVALGSALALALSACGSSDDASTDAMADNVEVPADESMVPVESAAATPVPDASATEDATEAVEKAEAAGNAALDAVSDFEAAAGEGTAQPAN